MKRARYTLIIGLTISFLPFLGLPVRYYRLFLPIIGVIFVIDALKQHYLFHANKTGSKRTNKPTKETITSTKKPLQEKRRSFFSKAPILARNKEEEIISKPEVEEITATELPEEIEVEDPKKNLSDKYLRLSALMIGYKLKQDTETSRLAGRIRIDRMRHNEPAEILTPTYPEPTPIIQAIEEEEIEVIVDDDLLGPGELTNNKTAPELAVNQEEIIPPIIEPEELAGHPTVEDDLEPELETQEIEEKIIDETTLQEQEPTDETEVIYSHERVTQQLHPDLLARIGDEIDE